MESSLQESASIFSKSEFIDSSCRVFSIEQKDKNLSGLTKVRSKSKPPISKALRDWSCSDSSLLFLMGEAGIGKTYALKSFWNNIASDWIADSKNKIVPFYMDLRLFSGVRMTASDYIEFGPTLQFRKDHEDHLLRRFRAIFLDNLQNREGVKIFWSDFREEVRSGRILLILDGLDEMTSDGNIESVENHLKLLAKFISKKSKVIIACRNHYLRSEEEFLEYVNRSMAKSVSTSWIDLLDFDDNQRKKFLGQLVNTTDQAIGDIKSVGEMGLMKLTARPYLLAKFVDNSEKLLSTGTLQQGELFETFVDAWLDRDSWRFQRFMNDFEDSISSARSQSLEGQSTDNRNRPWHNVVLIKFIETLSIEMTFNDKNSISADGIRSLISTNFPSTPNIFIAFFEYAIRTCTFLIRGSDNNYSFVDNSIQLFFSMRKICNDILIDKYRWDEQDVAKKSIGHLE